MSRLPSKIVSLFLLVVMSALPLISCTRLSARQPDGAPIEVTIKIDPDPARIGSAQVQIALVGASGQAITGAQLDLRGDMTHPGMQPVLAEAREIEPGMYTATMAWTMAGDWVLIIDGTLADGSPFSRQVDFRVSDE